ncbi:SMP-30/gluconolactonase/LRE family protein [Sphingobacterium sp. SYP-B4668]|uniref:SMP-30/gluconolactonase/LRE family protein n=1 Tax=Sphingobacterium sp. SYP-B4668 TaxID=2996035 RepID=UPI0022DD6085|nr:SMP-30/gluconolactonase/LRE family protein [Sphingobacterium sp. SYP-B4668]
MSDWPDLNMYSSDIMLTTDFYTEGPVIGKQGEIYVTNILGGQILRIDDRYTMDEWAVCKSPNGQFMSTGGDHFVCNTLDGTIEHYDSKGNFVKTWFKGKLDDHLVKATNDLWVKSDGSIFFTDSVRINGAIGYITPQGEAQLIKNGLDYPNGIVYDTLRNFLYVAESYQNRILKVDVSRTGAPVEVLVDLPIHPSRRMVDNLPDGLAMDGNSHLLIAHYGMGLLHRYDLASRTLRSFHTQIPLTSNVAIGDGCIVITGGMQEPGPGKIRILKR